MKTLVTGGAGFIGSHVAEHLLADGHDVVVLDNFAGGNAANLGAVIDHPRLDLRQADITELKSVRPLFEGVDWVFHLAGLADIVPSVENPTKYIHANLNGTITVLEAARDAKVARFVYAASSSCYGLPDQFPTPETAPARPMYPYALSKYLGEQCVLHWDQVYKLPGVSLRLFNVYGPRVRTTGTYGAVFGVFLAQKLANQPFTVVGDGSQTRDFTYVTDVAACFVKAAESGVKGEVMNVGSGQTYSINHLVRLLGGDVVHLPKRPGEPDCTFADTTKNRQLLGWKPQISFEEGVKMMLDKIELWRDAPLWGQESISQATEPWFKYLGQSQQQWTNNGP